MDGKRRMQEVSRSVEGQGGRGGVREKRSQNLMLSGLRQGRREKVSSLAGMHGVQSNITGDTRIGRKRSLDGWAEEIALSKIPERHEDERCGRAGRTPGWRPWGGWKKF